QATGVTTNIVGSGLSTVNVGNAGSTQGIDHTLSIENQTFTYITVDDTADTTARTVTFSTLGTNTSDSEGNTDSWGRISGLSPGNIYYEYRDTPNVRIMGGSGGNTFAVQSTVTPIILNPGSGNSTVNVSNAGSVQGIAGAV